MAQPRHGKTGATADKATFVNVDIDVELRRVHEHAVANWPAGARSAGSSARPTQDNNTSAVNRSIEDAFPEQ
jgi:hypothetical protein